MSSEKLLVLVDGSSYLYRAFHAMPYLSNSKGFPTGAVYGVINMLKSLLKDYKADYIGVIFDSKGKTFRDELFDKYKANRSEMPDDLERQIPAIFDIIKAMGLPLIMVEGVEADDIIGTLAKIAEKKQIKTLVSTGDKDLAQLVNENVTLVNTMSNTLLTPDAVKEKFGIPPECIVDYLALVGDSIDNIPGVPQVGPKTAVKWLLEYGSLDNIIKNADKITGKVGENLRAHLSQIPLAKQLATIKIDVTINFTLEDLFQKKPNTEILLEFYKDLEFKTWLGELLANNTSAQQNHHQQYQTICSEDDLDQWIKYFSEKKLLAVSTEGNNDNYMDAKIIGISFAAEPGKAIYLPCAHSYEKAPKQISLESALKKLKPLLENPSIQKIGQNLKYDIELFANHGIHLQGITFDTMLESYILDSASSNHALESLALKYLAWRTIAYAEIAGKGAKEISYHEISIESAAPYSSENADVALRLHESLWPKIQNESGLKNIYEKIEMPLVSVLAKIERNGVLIDAKKLEKQTIDLEKRVAELERNIFTLCDATFNIGSPKQLQDILFNKLKLPILQKTPTGQPSTAESVLQELAYMYEVPKLIMEYRSLSKLITTYTKTLPQQINKTTGRVHTSYNQTGAATGRLSSSDPNLQNIPIRTEEGRRIRQAFIASKGYKIITADYSQIELRLMAHISEDPNLLDAFSKNLDIHQATAAEVLGIPLEKVTNDQRRSAKAINFGLIYGMSSFGLSKQLDISRDEAQMYITKYFERYPKVRAYMENTRAQAHKTGYVETLWGRRLYLPDINSSQMMRQKAAERAAINAPLQGSAADIIKTAMINIDDWLQKKEIDAKMIMQVHDELVFEVAEKDVPKAMEKINEYMTAAIKLKVPLEISIGAGENWDEASG